eukprot:29380-Pelagococcus_subviridis.AAC.2
MMSPAEFCMRVQKHPRARRRAWGIPDAAKRRDASARGRRGMREGDADGQLGRARARRRDGRRGATRTSASIGGGVRRRSIAAGADDRPIAATPRARGVATTRSPRGGLARCVKRSTHLGGLGHRECVRRRRAGARA